MPLCPGPECEHFWKETKYPRKCFYEAQCINPLLDQIAASFRASIICWMKKMGAWFWRSAR